MYVGDMFQHVRLQIAISYCSIRNNLSLKSLLSVHFTDFDTIESFKPDTMVLNTIVDCLDESYVDPVPGRGRLIEVLTRIYLKIEEKGRFLRE